ncbi:MAG: hypothetical protein RJA81_1814 [Planctomycetota bacterium]|jgi:hypothetical protein
MRKSFGNHWRLDSLVSANLIEELAGVVSIKEMSDNVRIALR